MSAHPSQPRAGTGLIVAGFVFAILIPIVGLILGILTLNKGSKGPGWGIIALSAVFILLGIVTFAL
jgi:hypothetical protein